MARDLKTIKASEFRAKCLGLIDQVANSGQEVVITKNQKPVAKLSPYRQHPKTLFGIDKGKLKIAGDIMGPIEADWSHDWDNLKGSPWHSNFPLKISTIKIN